MIKQKWMMSEEERNRIITLHKCATKNLYLIKEQTQSTSPTKTNNTFPETKLGNNFEYGKFESERVKNLIFNLKPQIEEFIKNSDSSKFVVNITAGESQVTNPKGFEERGSLALARANSVSNYFKELFPDLIKKGILVINSPQTTNDVRIGTTPYGGKGSGDFEKPNLRRMYEQEQFVNFNIVGEGQKTKSVCSYSKEAQGGYADPSKNFIYLDENIDISQLNNGEQISIVLYPFTVPDMLVVSDGTNTYNTGFVGESSDLWNLLLATILVKTYGVKIPSGFPQNPTPVDKKQAYSIIGNEGNLSEMLQHVFPQVKGKNAKQIINDKSINFYTYPKNVIVSDYKNPAFQGNYGGIATITKKDGMSNINVKVYAPIGITQWKLKGFCNTQ